MNNLEIVKEVSDYHYDKLRDGDLWRHPMMDALMTILARDGCTPMSKDTQISLVKAALFAAEYSTNQPTALRGQGVKMGLNLRKLIEILEAAENKTVPVGFGSPHSYRGYYDQLAFKPVENTSVKDMLEAAKSALDKTFTGYKGGEYLMDGSVEVNIAEYGCCGEPITYLMMAYMLDDLDIWRNRE